MRERQCKKVIRHKSMRIYVYAVVENAWNRPTTRERFMYRLNVLPIRFQCTMATKRNKISNCYKYLFMLSSLAAWEPLASKLGHEEEVDPTTTGFCNFDDCVNCYQSTSDSAIASTPLLPLHHVDPSMPSSHCLSAGASFAETVAMTYLPGYSVPKYAKAMEKFSWTLTAENSHQGECFFSRLQLRGHR
eukprot:scaffold3924_cov109-Cylindrotheca_fusiformis.AAC.12